MRKWRVKLKDKKEIKILAEKLVKQDYPFVVQKDEMGYYITVPDFKGCSTWVTSFDELEQTLHEIKLVWIETALEKGLDIPKPTEESQFSGKFLVRCPKTIHKRLVETARKEGVSLNQYVVSILAENSLGNQTVQIVENKIARVAEKSYVYGVRFAQQNLSFNLEYPSHLEKYGAEKKVKFAA